MLMSPEVAYLLLSINRIGAISNFIAVNSTEQELKKQLTLVDSSIVFVDEIPTTQSGKIDYKELEKH